MLDPGRLAKKDVGGWARPGLGWTGGGDPRLPNELEHAPIPPPAHLSWATACSVPSSRPAPLDPAALWPSEEELLRRRRGAARGPRMGRGRGSPASSRVGACPHPVASHRRAPIDTPVPRTMRTRPGQQRKKKTNGLLGYRWVCLGAREEPAGGGTAEGWAPRTPHVVIIWPPPAPGPIRALVAPSRAGPSSSPAAPDRMGVDRRRTRTMGRYRRRRGRDAECWHWRRSRADDLSPPFQFMPIP